MPPELDEFRESSESPEQRIERLTDGDLRFVMALVVASILVRRDARGVPEILNATGLLTRREMREADRAWTDMEELVKVTARRAMGNARF